MCSVICTTVIVVKEYGETDREDMAEKGVDGGRVR
jgi:hypothetical protein